MGGKQSKSKKASTSQETPTQDKSTPTHVPPTEVPTTEVPPTEVPPTEVTPKEVPVVMQLSEHLQKREYYALKAKVHGEDIEQLEKVRDDLENEVLGIKTPVYKYFGYKRFEKLRQDVIDLEDNIAKHNDECYAIFNLRLTVADIKDKIELLVEDNKIYLSWFGINAAMAGASLGTAFIPVVGLIISPVLASIPYIGRQITRVVVSKKRKKKFKNQKAIKEK